jgi:hypothetical protein
MAQGTTKGVPIDIDPLLANNSDLLVPSQKAVKTYITANAVAFTSLSANSPLSYNNAGVFSISQATTSTNGYLSSTDWTTFNGKQNALSGSGIVKSTSGTISYITDNSTNWDTAYTNRITSLTTTGSSGSSTLSSNTLNIPTYTLAGLGGITLTSISSTATGLTYTNTTGVFSLTSGYTIPTTASYNNTNWDTAYTDRNKWDGGSTGLVAATGRTSLGATTVGGNLFTLTNPSAITFPRLNADNTVSALSASDFRTAIGAGTSSLNDDLVTLGQQALGSGIKSVGLGCRSLANITASLAMTDGQIYLSAVYLPAATTITGAKWFQIVAGVYTADNYNGIGLYTYSGGTLTLVASSTDDGTIWKSTGALSKAFSSPYSAAAGVYFLGFIYNSSAQTTAPSITGATNKSSGAYIDFTNSAKINATLTAATLTTPITMSSTTGVQATWGMFLY